MTQLHVQYGDISPSLGGTPILALPAESSLDFLEAAFDCYRRGQVFAIMRGDIDPGDYGLTISPGHLAGARKGWGQLDYRADCSDLPAQVVFTSGTEGRPKAIVLSHRNLADVIQRLNAAMGVTGEIREYIGVPVTYSFGLGRARAVTAAGGSFYLPERFDPSEIRQMLEDGQINAISAVPSLWQAVLAAPEAMAMAGGHVRWIEIGSQYMSGTDKAAMKRLFPNARIIQHYGLTEASRSTFLDISASAGEALDSVGEATGTVEIRIAGEGAIAIRGDHVAMGRLDQTGAVIPLTQGGWLVTRDRGEIRDGRLYYLGRLDDQINVSGIKLGAEALEAEIAALVPAATGRFAITPVPDRLRGEAVLLAIEKGIGDHGPLLAEAAKLALERRGIAAAGVLKHVTLDILPRTGTNKIQRREIARHYQPENSAPVPLLDATVLTGAQKRVAQSWAKVLGSDRIAPEQSFFDLGGDSLSSVQIGLVMEGAGFARPAIRATLAGRSLAEVADLTSETGVPVAHTARAEPLPDRTLRNWGLSIARGIMVLSVLLSHWGPGLFARLGIERQAEAALSFFYRMGTPGFAAVFGIGVGFFMLADFDQKRDSALTRMRSSFRLVAGGLVLLGLTKLALALLKGDEIGGLKLGQAFYGVLAYYTIMLGTARWWLPALARIREPMIPLLAISLGSWVLWQITGPLIGPAQWHNPLEWVRLMLQAGYNVFKMTSVAAAGTAVGYWLARETDAARAGQRLLILGALGAAFTLFTMVETKGAQVLLTRGGDGVFTSLAGLAFYLSVAMLFLGSGIGLLRFWPVLPGLLRHVLQFLIVIGGLALPIYVLHQLVMPLRNILVQLGLPGSIALALSMGSFLILMGYAGRRLWRMYF
jgi:hypothetical protein